MRNPLRSLLTLGLSTLIVACGGGGGGGENHYAAATPTPVPTTDNVQTISVNGGPIGAPNLAYTSVTVCVPGTTQCQTINNIMIDTGSEGLRVLASALGNLSLPQQTTAANHPLVECLQFIDLSHIWGPVKLADIKIAGEIANSVPIQVAGDAAFSNEPVTCAGGDSSTNMNTVTKMAGNGILGVGHFQQDCGAYCTTVIANNRYFDCPDTTCTQTTATLASQVQNPVALFATDNNGVIINLPAVPASGSASVSGQMIFGIGTRANNALGSAVIHPLDNIGYFTTTYKSVDYTRSFIDSGSNGLFFPDSSIPTCNNAVGFYCPTSTQQLSATITDLNDVSVSISFSVVNTESLNGSLNAFNNLAGYYSGGFDWGMPFFFGRKVYTGLETNPEGAYDAF